MQKTLFLFICFALLASVTARGADRPNLLFILADDLGWADTTLYGHTELYQTPNLDRLAKRGMTFHRAYTSSPLCSPTRSAILTGLHPARTGITSPSCHLPEVVLKATVSDSAPPDRKLTRLKTVSRLSADYETLGKRLKREGYATAHFGKWHLGAEPYSPLRHGFDIDLPHHPGPGPAGSYVAPWKFRSDFKEKYPGEHIEDRMGDEITAFLEAHKDSEQPFFINYWQFSVHGPFDAKAALIEKYKDRIDPDDPQKSPTYAAMVESLDDNVGKVLDALDRLGLADNTIIIFYSDNGGNMYNEIDGTTPTSNRPLRGGKGNNWDGGVRVPLIVAWPGVIEAGSRNRDSLVTSTDFYPTILEMLRLDPPPEQSFDGVSILPALRGKPFHRAPIFTYFPHQTKVPDATPESVAVYRDQWKLIRFLHGSKDGSHQHRLFNLENDIGERRDVLSENQAIAGELIASIDQFLAETKAVYPRLNPRWNPQGQIYTSQGWKATRNCRFSPSEAGLKITINGERPNITVQLEKPLPAGSYTFRAKQVSPKPIATTVRWAEQGVKPHFYKDRLVNSKPAEAGQWSVSFEAKKPLTGFRLDPREISKGTIVLSEFVIEHNGGEVKKWKFAP